MSDLDKSPAQPYVVETTGPTVGPVPNFTIPSGGGGAPGGVSGNVQYNASGSFGGYTDIQLTAHIQLFSSTLSGAVPASGGNPTTFLRADGTFAVPVLASGTVTYSMIQSVSASPRVLGNNSGGPATIQELTGTNLATFIDLFTSTTRGQVPPSAGGSTNFLRADGVWVSPGSSGLPGGVSGQFQFNNAGSFGGVTMSGDATWDSGTGILTVASNAITYGKIQKLVANNVVLGNVSGANTNAAELTPTQLTTLVNVFTSSLSGAVPSSGGGTVNFLRADGTWVPPPGGSGGTPGGALNSIQWNSAGSFAGFTMNGDATLVPSTGVITIVNSAVTYAKIQNVSIGPSFLGRSSSGAGVVQEITPTQATAQLNVFTSTLQGVVPSSGGGTTNFLRADGTWIAPGGAGAPGGTNGQIQYNNASAFGGFTVGGDATLNTGSGVLTIANLAVTYAKMQNISANNRILGNVSGAAGPVTELTPTQVTTQINLFTTLLSGAVPASGGGTTNFLRADGSWTAPGGAGAPGGTTLQLQYNNAGAFGGMSGTSWDDTNRSLTMTGVALGITANHPIFNQTQIWNNPAVTFTGGRTLNITDNGSNINSLFDDLQVGGVSKWSVRKDGTVTVGAWGGTPIAAPQGGTGQSSYAIGDTLYASSTTALSKLPGNITTARQVLTQTGTGLASAAPVWASLTPATTTKGATPAWSDTIGTLTDGKGAVNILAFGVDNTGNITFATANRIAINNAWASNPVLHFPAGKYYIDAPLTPPNVNGMGIIGDGSYQDGTVNGGSWTSSMGGTLIITTDLNNSVITCSSAISKTTFIGFTLVRSSQASVNSAYGITIENGDDHLINDLYLANHGIGINFGFQGGYAIAQNVRSIGNKSHGVQLQGQWQLYNILSESNGGDGFNLSNPHSLGTNSSGQWSRLSTFNNSGWGFNCTVSGTSQALEGFRVNDSFFGNDVTGEMNLNSFAGNAHKFTGCQFECGAQVGPTLIVPTAIVISANNPSIMFDNCYITTGTAPGGGGSSGIVSALTATARTSNGALATLNVSNTNIIGVNFGVANTGSGIHCTGAGARILISNCTIDSFRNPINLDTGASQQLNVSNCSIWAQSDLYAGAGVVGIFMQSNGGKASITNTQIGGLLSANNFAIGVDLLNSATGAATVIGCNINTNTTPANTTGTGSTYTAGNY